MIINIFFKSIFFLFNVDHYYIILQKVDIYSLGIIFFEMCYRPFSTDMERHKTLMNLRCASRILFPDDFINKKTAQRQKVTLIRYVLLSKLSKIETSF